MLLIMPVVNTLVQKAFSEPGDSPPFSFFMSPVMEFSSASDVRSTNFGRTPSVSLIKASEMSAIVYFQLPTTSWNVGSESQNELAMLLTCVHNYA